VHIERGEATLYSKSGADYTKRFRSLHPLISRIPVKSTIIDCELVACDEAGMPCFRPLMDLGNKAPLYLWCFDLLYLNGVRFMPMPIEQRKAILADVIALADNQHFQFSGNFDDPIKLLETCERMGLEGIVSKRRASSYASGPTRDWQKIKTTRGLNF
jgi:bifunctional non-homologous end joining protein LigD